MQARSTFTNFGDQTARFVHCQGREGSHSDEKLIFIPIRFDKGAVLMSSDLSWRVVGKESCGTFIQPLVQNFMLEVTELSRESKVALCARRGTLEWAPGRVLFGSFQLSSG